LREPPSLDLDHGLPEVWAAERNVIASCASLEFACCEIDNGKALEIQRAAPQARDGGRDRAANRSPLVLPSLHPFSFSTPPKCPSDAAF